MFANFYELSKSCPSARLDSFILWNTNRATEPRAPFLISLVEPSFFFSVGVLHAPPPNVSVRSGPTRRPIVLSSRDPKYILLHPCLTISDKILLVVAIFFFLGGDFRSRRFSWQTFDSSPIVTGIYPYLTENNLYLIRAFQVATKILESEITSVKSYRLRILIINSQIKIFFLIFHKLHYDVSNCLLSS